MDLRSVLSRIFNQTAKDIELVYVSEIATSIVGDVSADAVADVPVSSIAFPILPTTNVAPKAFTILADVALPLKKHGVVFVLASYASSPQNNVTSLKVLSSGTMTHFGKSRVAALAAPAMLARKRATTKTPSAFFRITSTSLRGGFQPGLIAAGVPALPAQPSTMNLS
ncbi:hypothetical protein [Thermococcus thioreducens]|uniref:Uncharacterized protein n=1 Tax=Thermococcus thioreducens TaxID=277988 RepID=A0A0Q2RGR5_9EURY|nr:hypothetical protein [Thermococcus thioreducens]ASJ13355.1 hypothetical protein A3L14_10905 [Thermococcus thioreducens]KQH83238.1 hypothetical protein AMR53_00705 [Thermococcus thioreducens]